MKFLRKHGFKKVMHIHRLIKQGNIELAVDRYGAGTISRFIELFLGLALLSPMFSFIYTVMTDNNTSAVTGADIIVPLIGVFACLGLVYDSVKHIKK